MPYYNIKNKGIFRIREFFDEFGKSDLIFNFDIRDIEKPLYFLVISSIYFRYLI